MAETAAAADLCARLEAFSTAHPYPGAALTSFIAMFDQAIDDEACFERQLWSLLQAMHEHDRSRFGWDPTVGQDPALKDFSLSIAGRAFFIVGLHPGASRLARRAPFPCVVFNLHNQFKSLRESGKYQILQKAIRERDIHLQGSINPVLAQFGEASEARQYSGAAVNDDWRCPFQARERACA